MPGAGRQQREIFGAPPPVDECFDLVVADVHGLVATAGDEGDRRSFAAEKSHRVVDEGLPPWWA
jgi:hypothetical protein